VHFNPYVDKDVNRLQVINEGAFLLMSYQIIAFTDFNPDVDNKNFFGWTMVFTSGINFIFPNFYLVCVGMWPDIKDAIFTKKEPEDMKKELARKFFEKKRQKLISKYNFKLKEVEEEKT